MAQVKKSLSLDKRRLLIQNEMVSRGHRRWNRFISDMSTLFEISRATVWRDIKYLRNEKKKMDITIDFAL